MIITPEKQKELKEAAKPLMKWLCENCHPHVIVIVEPTRIELLEGVAADNCDEFVKD